MTVPERETAHLLRIFEMLQCEEVKVSFFELLHRLYSEERLTFRFLPRGNFSAVHLLFDPQGTPYGDAEFAFKGSKDHMRWWFRPPCFESGLLRLEEIRERLQFTSERQDGHVVTDIRNSDDVDSVMDCVKLAHGRLLKV